jgi:hypothetical protein
MIRKLTGRQSDVCGYQTVCFMSESPDYCCPRWTPCALTATAFAFGLRSGSSATFFRPSSGFLYSIHLDLTLGCAALWEIWWATCCNEGTVILQSASQWWIEHTPYACCWKRKRHREPVVTSLSTNCAHLRRSPKARALAPVLLERLLGRPHTSPPLWSLL